MREGYYIAKRKNLLNPLINQMVACRFIAGILKNHRIHYF
jgi:hypothetical protein